MNLYCARLNDHDVFKGYDDLRVINIWELIKIGESKHFHSQSKHPAVSELNNDVYDIASMNMMIALMHQNTNYVEKMAAIENNYTKSLQNNAMYDQILR